MRRQSDDGSVSLHYQSSEEFYGARQASVRPEEKNIRILYMGCPEFSLPPLRQLVEEGYNVVAVATQPDRPVGRKQTLSPTCTKVLAEELSIPVYQWEKLTVDCMGNDLDFIQPEIIITSAYGNLLPKQVLDYPRYGCLNIHPSKLPRWRGASPVASAIMAGDADTAVCIIEMGVGLDDGDIVSSCLMAIDEEIDTPSLTEKLAHLSADLLLALLPYWYRGEAEAIKQKDNLATYAKKLERDDGLLDFTLSAKANADKVRALHPWPGAYAYYGNKRYKIHRASVLDVDVHEDFKFGEIRRRGKDLILACRDGLLRVEILQSPGGKILEASDCYHNFEEGTCFSSHCDEKGV